MDKTLSLHQVIELGEYRPEYLQKFSEWHQLSAHIQWQFIKKAMEIRHKQLIADYAELNNALYLSKKPHVQQAMKNIEKQLDLLMQDQEDLYVEWSTKS